MDESGRAFIAGIVIGAAAFAGFVTLFPGSTIYRANVAIEQCEKELPRSQKCVVTAKPEVKP